ncbi:MAG: hypothetical protein JSU86_20335 [Phycisphaerales bacterium]|nr:MAG: hypothetical protein JSU86_20335 [Phycisphaerales bacterium]
MAGVLITYALVPALFGATVLVLWGLRTNEYASTTRDPESGNRQASGHPPGYVKGTIDFASAVVVGFFFGWVGHEGELWVPFCMVLSFGTGAAWVRTFQTVRSGVSDYVRQALRAAGRAAGEEEDPSNGP